MENVSSFTFISLDNLAPSRINHIKSSNSWSNLWYKSYYLRVLFVRERSWLTTNIQLLPYFINYCYHSIFLICLYESITNILNILSVLINRWRNHQNEQSNTVKWWWFRRKSLWPEIGSAVSYMFTSRNRITHFTSHTGFHGCPKLLHTPTLCRNQYTLLFKRTFLLLLFLFLLRHQSTRML